MPKPNDKMQKIISLAKRRGFIFPGSEIYGGLANSFDFGPLGVELKNNIKTEWWRRFVKTRGDMVGLDAALLMNPRTWEASGHLGAGFSDEMVECKECHSRFRFDALTKKDVCAHCGAKKSFTNPKQFNLMLKTYLGPVEDATAQVYLRPETAQGIFVNFKNVLDTTRKRVPFGIAQIGKAFRNEITPGNYVFRTREFEQLEIEYFVRETEWEGHFKRWLNEMKLWIKDLGISEDKVHYEEVGESDRAHYSKRTIDIEYDFPFGQKELYGLAYRTDHDLKAHQKASGTDLSYTDPETGDKFIPHVIEPSFGLERTILAVLLESYHEESAPTAEEGETEIRVVLKFPKWLAPIKVAILPLMKKDELTTMAKELYEDLAQDFACDFDQTGSIGKRYRRQDEVGTPYCVTIDYDSLKDQTVTVRERDTMNQERITISELGSYLHQYLTVFEKKV